MSDPRNDSSENNVSDEVPVTPDPFAVGFSEPASGVVEIEDDLGPDLLNDPDLDEDDDDLDDPVLDRPDGGDVELNEGDPDDNDELGLDDDDEFDDAELDAVSEPYELGTHRVVTDPDAGSYTDIDVDPDDDELER